jgi:hypothetical protein
MADMIRNVAVPQSNADMLEISRSPHNHASAMDIPITARVPRIIDAIEG